MEEPFEFYHWQHSIISLREALRRINTHSSSSNISLCVDLLRKTYTECISDLSHLPVSLDSSSKERSNVQEAIYRAIQELYSVLAGPPSCLNSSDLLLCSALLRLLIPSQNKLLFFSTNFNGDFSQYSPFAAKHFISFLSQLQKNRINDENLMWLLSWQTKGLHLLSQEQKEKILTNDGNRDSLDLSGKSYILDSLKNDNNNIDSSTLYQLCRLSTSLLTQRVIKTHLDWFINPKNISSIEIIETCLTYWLNYASRHSNTIRSKSLLALSFLKPPQPSSVLEPDYTSCSGTFTLLNISEDYTLDQKLNVQAFSSLYKWILCVYKNKLIAIRKYQIFQEIFGPSNQIDSELNNNNITSLSEIDNSTSNYPELSKSFRQAIVSYCLRLLGQIEAYYTSNENNATNRYEIEAKVFTNKFYDALQIEIVRILDVLCTSESNLLLRISPIIKGVYDRYSNHLYGGLFPTLFQFWLNHGYHVMINWSPIFDDFFIKYINKHYRDPIIGMNIFLFISSNTFKLQSYGSALSNYFPSIFKLLAYHPRTLLNELLPILPILVQSADLIELFNSILDLPLTSLLLCTPSTDFDEIKSLNPNQFDLLHAYVLRNSTINQQFWDGEHNTIKKLLQDISWKIDLSPRVLAISKLSPKILESFLEIVLHTSSDDQAEVLFKSIFKRFTLILHIDFHLENVQSIFIKFLKLFGQKWRLKFLSIPAILTEAISTHLDKNGIKLVQQICWSLGEYLTPSALAHTQIDIDRYFDTLEHLCFIFIHIPFDVDMEDTNLTTNKQKHLTKQDTAHLHINTCTFQTISILQIALFKICLRFKRFLPRVILCFYKALEYSNFVNNQTLLDTTKQLLTHLENPPLLTSLLDICNPNNYGHFDILESDLIPFKLETQF